MVHCFCIVSVMNNVPWQQDKYQNNLVFIKRKEESSYFRIAKFYYWKDNNKHLMKLKVSWRILSCYT